MVTVKNDNVLSIALLTIFGQYTAALRLAILVWEKSEFEKQAFDYTEPQTVYIKRTSYPTR